MLKPASKVEVLFEFCASADDVFDAWLDPDVLSQWMFDASRHDQTVVKIEIDPRPGAEFLFNILRFGRPIEFRGKYTCIEKPSRLAFTWRMSGDDNETYVSIQIEPTQSGCRLKLVHDLGRVSAKTADMATSEWESELTSLFTVLKC